MSPGFLISADQSILRIIVWTIRSEKLQFGAPVKLPSEIRARADASAVTAVYKFRSTLSALCLPMSDKGLFE